MVLTKNFVDSPDVAALQDVPDTGVEDLLSKMKLAADIPTDRSLAPVSQSDRYLREGFPTRTFEKLRRDRGKRVLVVYSADSTAARYC